MNFEFTENTVIKIPLTYRGYRLESGERVRFRCLFKNGEGDFPYTADIEEDNKGQTGDDGKYTVTLDMSRYGISPGRYAFDLSLVLESGSLVTIKTKDECCIDIVPASEGLDKPNGEIFFGADYIVEQGTDGIWTYRKWASGIAECWGVNTIKFNTAMSSNGNYAVTGEMITVTLPDNLFNKSPVISLTPMGGGYPDIGIGNIYSTHFTVSFRTEWAVTDMPDWVQCICYGRWK